MALLQNKLTKAASSFGIGAPDMGPTTQVAKANTPAANDSSVGSSPSAEAPSTSGAPGMQSALYKPSADAPPKPKMVSSGAPSFTPVAMQTAMRRDIADSQVGSMDTATKNLLSDIADNAKVQVEQRDIQQKILDLLGERLGAKADSGESSGSISAPAASPSTTPQVDRRPRKVSDPIIDTRRVA